MTISPAATTPTSTWALLAGEGAAGPAALDELAGCGVWWTRRLEDDKLLKIEHIREKADFLLANMAFFFLPAGVSVINYFDVLGRSAVALVLVCLLSTVITFGATALSIRFTLRLLERRKSRV